MPAHPRACGENRAACLELCGGEGSSPRVRGKHQSADLRCEGAGLIPARAGKTPSVGRTRSPETAHPRACGENKGPDLVNGHEAGSSPRVRGKPRPLRPRDMEARLIPARAGKTGGGRGGGFVHGAHPRACGENRPTTRASAASAGSSPRVRGKLSNFPDPEFMPRLIPARAGKTASLSRVWCPGWAHPRACGENVAALSIEDRLLGSSPRVRGKRRPPRARRPQSGLIPARAGKTHS